MQGIAETGSSVALEGVPAYHERPEVREVRSIGRIFADYGRSMFERAKRLLRSEADADDVVQEVMANLLRAPHLLADVEHVGGWLLTLVHRRCVDIFRREKRREGAVEERFLLEVFEQEGPAESAEQNELWEAISEAVGALPDELRLAFLENAVEEKPFREISEETGIPMGTLMARKQKALGQIRECLGQKGLITGKDD